MNLSYVHGDGYGTGARRALACAYTTTLAETPIKGLFFENVSISGKCGAAFACSAFVGNDTSGNVERLYATGHAQDHVYARRKWRSEKGHRSKLA